MPGQPARAYAHFWNVPRQFTLENRRLPLTLPQSSGKFRNLSRFDDPLCDNSLQTATGNSRILVQKLWRMRLACGRRRKSKKLSSFLCKVLCCREPISRFFCEK